MDELLRVLGTIPVAPAPPSGPAPLVPSAAASAGLVPLAPPAPAATTPTSAARGNGGGGRGGVGGNGDEDAGTRLAAIAHVAAALHERTKRDTDDFDAVVQDKPRNSKSAKRGNAKRQAKREAAESRSQRVRGSQRFSPF